MKSLISLFAIVFVCSFAVAQSTPAKEVPAMEKKACCKDKMAKAEKSSANAAAKKSCCADKKNAKSAKACSDMKDKKACAEGASANAAAKKSCCEGKKEGEACKGKKMGAEKANMQAKKHANMNSAVQPNKAKAVPAMK